MRKLAIVIICLLAVFSLISAYTGGEPRSRNVTPPPAPIREASASPLG